jgi:hypothetical protein
VRDVDPTWFGFSASGQSLTYQNLEQRGVHLTTYTLQRWVNRLERAYFKLLPRPQYVKFNLDGLKRADLGARMNAYRVGLGPTQAFLTLNEVRARRPAPCRRRQAHDRTDLLHRCLSRRTGHRTATSRRQLELRMEREAFLDFEQTAGPARRSIATEWEWRQVDGGKTLMYRGHASTTEQEYPVYGGTFPGWVETMASGAFKRTINNQADVSS